MQLRHEDAARFLQTHNGVLGAGWKEVQSFEELEDEEEFEEEEEVCRLNFPSGSMLRRVGRIHHAGYG